MSKITRVFQKLFGSSAGGSDVGEFGSKTAGSPTYTTDPDTIQALAAFLGGFASAVDANGRPYLEDVNALFLLGFRQLAYLFQSGMPEWDASTTYYTGSFCQVSGVIYKSLVNSNINYAPASNVDKWEVLAYVSLTVNETIAGIKTFSSSPIVPTPTTDYQGSTKKYVDDKSAAITKATLGIDSGSQVVADGGTVINFNFSFAVAPVVVVTGVWGNSDHFAASIESVGTTGFTCYSNIGEPATVNWIAIGIPA